MLPAFDLDASEWSPTRPVQILVPSQAGGPLDTLARAVARQLSEQWGQPFVIENRTGAGGNLAMQFVARAPADGYTLGTAHGGTHGANLSLYGDKLPFHPLRDFTPITSLAEMKNVLVVHPSLKVTNLDELIVLAKARPGELTFGSSGSGTTQHLTGELFKAATAISILHVAYRGQAQALPDLLSGRISMMFLGAGDAAEHVRSGALVAIGIASKRRSSLLPTVAPLAEQGIPDFDAVTWFGLVGPAGLPEKSVDAYQGKISATFGDAEFRGRLEKMGIDPVAMTPADFRAFLGAELDKWGKVVKAVGVRLE
ncbi:MAG: tripartite tricarboxylate transporter substrate binding protein [Hyphomicrobiales bacterium]|nr:tripartite tricarboxylate transporter substrate binding protein [Hyphomicrobiales bacterium]